MNHVNPKEMGERIRFLRMAEGLTQEELADEFHYSTRAMISDWETGRRWISLECLVMYSERYKVSIDWIVTGEEASNINLEKVYCKLGSALIEIVLRETDD